MISIDTKRLHLRNVLQNDVDVIFDYRNNEICARYQRGQVKDYEGIVSLIERRRIVVMPKDHIFSLGYTFSYKYHRQGYAFEALTVLTEHLHKMAPEWEFISYTECENIASIKMLKKLGYKNLGYVPSLDSQAFGKWTTMDTEEEFAHLGK
jgi:ribosomal-protein-alanine N-acetyltransferase